MKVKPSIATELEFKFRQRAACAAGRESSFSLMFPEEVPHVHIRHPAGPFTRDSALWVILRSGRAEAVTYALRVVAKNTEKES